jgi:hypothetical protein
MSDTLATIVYGINLNHEKFSEFTQKYDYLLKSYTCNDLDQFWIGVELTNLHAGKIVSLFKLKLTPSEEDKLKLDKQLEQISNYVEVDKEFKKLIGKEKPDIFIVWSS